MIRHIGEIKSEVIELLDLKIEKSNLIYLGDSNIQHMIDTHPYDYNRYGEYISEIVNNPDYVGLNKKDNSIEYVKEFIENNKYVKVAVRISTNGKYYARSIYTLNNNRVKNFIENKTLLPIDKIV